MFDFGDELTIESYRIPWLIWIQVIVMLLLMVLLYGCTLSASDLHDCSSSSSASRFPQSQLHKGLVSTRFHPSQGGENQSIKGEIATGITRRIVRGEDNAEKEGPSSLKEGNQICLHPCHYFRLAKLAFLKCLGLDSSSSENSSNSEQRNER